MATGSPKTQTMHLPLDGGMDQRQHPRQLAAPSTIAAANVRYGRIGAADKRQGVDLVAATYSDGSAIRTMQGRLLAFRDELLAIDGYNIGSLALPGGSPKLLNKGKVPEAVSSARAIDTTQYYVSQPDVAYSTDGYMFHVWAANDRSTTEPRYDVFWTIQDVTTGAEIASAKAFSVNGFDFWGPRVVTAGRNAMMFLTNGTNIAAQVWDPTALTWTSLGTILSGTAGSGFAVCSDGMDVFIVYGRTTNIISVKRYNAVTGALIATVDCTENVLPTIANSFSICAPVGEQVWISYSRTSNPLATLSVRCATFTHNLSAQLVAPFTVYSSASEQWATTGIARLSATTAVILLGVTGSLGDVSDASDSYMAAPVVSSATSAVVGNASTANRRTYWAVPGSMPFVASTSPLRVYAWAYVGGSYLGALPPQPPDQSKQYTFMLVDIMSDDTATIDYVARPITWQAPRFALTDANGAKVPTVGKGTGFFLPPSVAALPDNTWVTDCIVRRNAATRIGLNEVKAVFGGPNRFIASELGRTMVMTPGFFWDRSKLAEISYAFWPQRIDTRTPQGPSATGGFMANGKDYGYRVVYEYVDATGAVHRSEPSEQVIVSIPGTVGTFLGSCSFLIPQLTVTAKQDGAIASQPNGVRIVVYRAGPLDVDPVTFYRVFSDNLTPQNSPKQATVSVTDIAGARGQSGASTQVQLDTLYTMGGVLPNVMPTSFTSVVTYLNRVWIAYGNTVTYSKAFVTGEAISFTDSFELPLEEAGDITALWVMDDTLYIATTKRIYYLQAYGPNDAGGGNDVNIPNRVATDLGVVDQRSIVVTPLGTLYQSPVGIQIMDRSRSVPAEPIGARVRDDLALYPEITSAILHPSGRYVTFSARDPVSPGGNRFNGVRLVFDYATNRWSRDTMVSDNDQFGQGLLSEAVSRGKVYGMYAASASNRIFVESPTSYLDIGLWVTMSVEIAEIHPAGLQGNMAFRKWTTMNERFTDHNIVLRTTRDYESSPIDTKTWASDALPAFEQFSNDATVEIAQSMRVKIADAFPSGVGAVVGTGKGAAFIGLAVEVETIDNLTWRLPAGSKG